MRKLVVLLAMPSDFDGIILNQTNFAKAKQYLGTQHFQALYDMRSSDGVCLHLEALAIIAGTIMNGGTLFLVCPDFVRLSQIPDSDSLRWNEGKLFNPYKRDKNANVLRIYARTAANFRTAT